jgi:hypothetical protein
MHTGGKAGSEELFRFVLERFFLEMLEQEGVSAQGAPKKNKKS